MWVLIFPINFVWNDYFQKNSAIYYQKFTYVFMLNTRYYCQISISLGLSQQIFEKYSNIKFHGTLSIGSWAVQCGIYIYIHVISTFIVSDWKWHTVVKQGKSVTVHDDETAEKEIHLDRENIQNIENVWSLQPKQWCY